MTDGERPPCCVPGCDDPRPLLSASVPFCRAHFQQWGWSPEFDRFRAAGSAREICRTALADFATRVSTEKRVGEFNARAYPGACYPLTDVKK